MKQLLLTLTFLFTISAFAQDQKECEKVIDIIAKSISNKSVSELNNYLADDFILGGNKGEAAKQLLLTIFNKLDQNIEKYEFKNERKGYEYRLVYDFYYSKLGKGPARFWFNKDNKLTGVELIQLGKPKLSIKRSSEDIITIPFKRARKLILVEAELNGQKRNFLLDSGAESTVLNARYLDTKNKPTIQGAGINGTTLSGTLIVESLDLNGIRAINQTVETTNLDHLEKELNTEIYGLLGFDFYCDYDILFDYEKSTLTLINPDKTQEYLSKNSKTITEVPAKMIGHLPVLVGKIDKKDYNWGIDCGVETNILSEKLYDSLKGKIKNQQEAGSIGADGNKKKVIKGNISIKFGKADFKDTFTALNNMEPFNKKYNANLDGLIGFEILSKYKTLISYRNNKVYFYN